MINLLDSIQKNRAKIFSVVFAILIWLLVITENHYEMVVSIPIKTQNLRQGYVITNDFPQKVKVRFRGKGRTLIALQISKNANVVVDLKGARGTVVHKITLKDVELTKSYTGMNLVNIVSPDTVLFEINELAVKSVPIKPFIEIKTVPGYAIIGDVQLEPDSVYVSGPRNFLSDFSFVETEKRVIKQCKKDIVRDIKLVKPRNKRLKLLQSKIVLTADIQKLMERKLVNIPVRIRNLPSNVKAIVIPSKLSLVIYGGVDILTKVKDADIKAYIDFKMKRRPNENDYPAFIDIPPGVNSRNVSPERFKVILEKNDSIRH